MINIGTHLRGRSITFILPLLALGLFLSACEGGKAGPPFLGGGEDEEKGLASPSGGVDEMLASEAGEQRLIYHVGPVDLPKGTGPGTTGAKSLTMRFQTDREIWATGFVPKVVDSHGKELPAELLEQAVVFNMHEENPLCAGSPNPFMAANAMLTGVELPKGFGYPILSTDPIEAKVWLKNTTDKDYSDVYFEFTLVAKKMDEFARISDVKPMMLELEPCKHTAVDAPPKEFTEKSATYAVPVKSKLIAATGVLGDFGSALELTANKSTLPFWRAEAIKDEEHRISALTSNPFEDRDGVMLAANDHLTLKVSYDNVSDKWLNNAAAAAVVYLAPVE